jgi:NADH-quinone oxidoreductase subunit B
MRWWLSSSAKSSMSRSTDDSLDEVVGRSLLLTRLQDLLGWGRKYSIWPFNFGLS